MTSEPMPSPPPTGEIRYFDLIQPPLAQGDYKVSIKQTFPTSVDGQTTGIPTQNQDKYIRVEGSRWSIDPLTIHSRSPPKNEQNVILDGMLPKIVFQSKTLPWERTIDDDDEIPWMGLLLIREDEFEAYCRILPDGLTSNDTLTGTSHDFLGSTTDPPIQIKILEISNKLLKAIGPKKEELSYLAHGLQVNPRDKELCGSDEDGIFSVILSNRIPSKEGTKYHACLVSFEEVLDRLPTSNDIDYITLPSSPQREEESLRVLTKASHVEKQSKKRANQTLHQQTYVAPNEFDGAKTLLVLLDSWTFKTGDGGDFASRIKNIKFRKHEDESSSVGRLGSIYDFANGLEKHGTYEPALLGNDMDPDVSINSFLLTEIAEDDGITRPCLYRGPCIAVPTNHEPKEEPYSNSDDARGIEPSTGLDVIHHAAAFEVGRLLALSDPKFVNSMTRWRILWNKKQQMIAHKMELFDGSTLHNRFTEDEIKSQSIQRLLQIDVMNKASVKIKAELQADHAALESFPGNPGFGSNDTDPIPEFENTDREIDAITPEFEIDPEFRDAFENQFGDEA